MSAFADIKAKWAKSSPFQVLPHIDWAEQKPTYQDAQPALINDALARAKSRPSGNWFPFAASDTIRHKPVGASVGGVELVAWRAPAANCVSAPRAVRISGRTCPPAPSTAAR